MRALLVALLCLLPFSAEAYSTFGQETVGDFRTWPEQAQFGYVAGWMGQSALLGTKCERLVTLGEYAASLRYNPRLQATDSLLKAMLALEVRDGCKAVGR